MQLVNLYIEHPVLTLNTTFSYLAQDECQLEKGIRVKVDFNGQNIIGFIDSVQKGINVNEIETKLGYQLKEIEEVIDEKPLLNEELFSLGLWLSHTTVSPIISCFQAMLPAALKPATNNQTIAKNKWVRILNESALNEYGFTTSELALSTFKEKVSEYKYKKFKEKGFIEVFEKEREASVSEIEYHQPTYELTSIQKQALEKINNSNKNVILLHGLTGSGKTEVYMQLVKQAIDEGKQALVLVPEISLTPMMIARFQNRFGNNIAIYHSGLSGQEKYEQYKLVKENKAKIVIGTRSAVFMPFAKLGIIILDEEHDNSYKQDSTPRYHSKDVAIKRGLNHHCKVILGSATPTLESYARALKEVYELVQLDKRVNDCLPDCKLVDMSMELRKGNYIISGPLLTAIQQRLSNNQQIILLLNRRGYTPIMKCANCGHVVTCPHCDITLSYHKDEEKLMCHCCGHSQSADMVCPECGKKKWHNYGLGTQRLVEEVQKHFPNAKVCRMDADTTANKDSHQKILQAFGNHEYDILVGTQMIAKGLDFPAVTLVGIFNADGPLNRNDYRAVETTFDLIVQASGRSGRAQDKGEVYVQAYDGSHYAIRLAIQQNYIQFFNNEMQYRHVGKYPPYSYMVSIVLGSKKEEIAKDVACKMIDFFRSKNLLAALGPSKLIKRKDEYRYRVLLKSTNKEEMIDYVWEFYNSNQFNKHQINIGIDVDPTMLD